MKQVRWRAVFRTARNIVAIGIAIVLAGQIAYAIFNPEFWAQLPKGMEEAFDWAPIGPPEPLYGSALVIGCFPLVTCLIGVRYQRYRAVCGAVLLSTSSFVALRYVGTSSDGLGDPYLVGPAKFDFVASSPQVRLSAA